MMVRIGPLLRTAALAVLLVPGRGVAQGTLWVPLDDPAYADLDLLVGTGLVRDLLTRSRPYTRSDFVRAAVEARAALRGEGQEDGAPGGRAGVARILEAVARLEARFVADAGARHRGVAFVASWAESPRRAVPQDPRPEAPYTGSLIEADVAPLLQRNLGVDRFDGATVAASGWADLSLGPRFAASVAPRLWLGVGSGEDDAGLALDRGYVRGRFGNLAVTVGRNHVVHGHAREYGPIFSTNARGLDMVRLSMERPGRLPWLFRHLGPIGVAGTIATMGSDRIEKGSVLVVWEGAIHPHPNLELGLTLTNQQGGEGAPRASFWERILEASFIQRRGAPGTTGLPADPAIGDKLIGADVRLTLPGPRLLVFAEVNTTDDHDLFVSRPRQTFIHEAAWAVGLRRYALGADGRWDVWSEAGRVGVRTYTHHQMTSGLTLDRRILGSPLGPQSAGVIGGVDWTGPRDRLSASVAWERYSNDTYIIPPKSEWWWTRTADNPDEIRMRGVVDWTRQAAVEGHGLRTNVRLGYEHVTRFDFTDRNRSNFLVQVGVGWVW